MEAVSQLFFLAGRAAFNPAIPPPICNFGFLLSEGKRVSNAIDKQRPHYVEINKKAATIANM